MMRIRKWADESVAEPETIVVNVAEGGWQLPDGSVEPLATLLSVQPGGALRIDSGDEGFNVWDVAHALPSEQHYAEFVERVVETGDQDLDALDVDTSVLVIINDVPWVLVRAESNYSSPDRWNWVPCGVDERSGEPVAPLSRRTIVEAGGIEEASRTSGWFGWRVEEIDNDAVCFVIEPDDEPTTYEVILRNGMSDRELIEQFRGWIDWEPVAAAVSAALEDGSGYHGYASALNPLFSESCEVSAHIDLNDEQ